MIHYFLIAIFSLFSLHTFSQGRSPAVVEYPHGKDSLTMEAVQPYCVPSEFDIASYNSELKENVLMTLLNSERNFLEKGPESVASTFKAELKRKTLALIGGFDLDQLVEVINKMDDSDKGDLIDSVFTDLAVMSDESREVLLKESLKLNRFYKPKLKPKN